MIKALIERLSSGAEVFRIMLGTLQIASAASGVGEGCSEVDIVCIPAGKGHRVCAIDGVARDTCDEGSAS